MGQVKGFVWKQILNFRGSILRNLSQFERWQWLDPKHVVALQQERLKRLLGHAYSHVPYYHKVLVSAGVINNGLVNLENFSQIPLLDKSTIRTDYEKLKSDDLSIRKWYENSSGGSSGEPIRVLQDKNYYEINTSIKKLYDLWSGYSIGEKKIILWGSVRDLLIGRETLNARLGRWLRQEIWLNAFRMGQEQMNAYAKCINTFKPAQILAYVESIYELSLFIEIEGLRVYSPRSIMTTAGTLDPTMRETIERVFNAPVFNRYGSREGGNIACECNHHKGLHISPLTHYVEVLRQDGTFAETGEQGEIVITLLTNYTMPLIRYRIGDMGVWAEKPCTCGRSWPLLVEVTGRVTDNFVTSEGMLLYGGFFRQLFFSQEWIKKYQIIQEDFNHIHILIVLHKQNGPTPEFYSEKMKEITQQIRLIMGQDCRVEFDFVDDIVPSPSGKYRYTISKVGATISNRNISENEKL